MNILIPINTKIPINSSAPSIMTIMIHAGNSESSLQPVNVKSIY